MTRAPPALLPRSATALRSPPYPQIEERNACVPNPPRERRSRRVKAAGSDAPAPLGRPQRTFLEPSAIVPEALHRKVGWDIRHHFMAEKIVDRFGLVLPRDRELIRQLAVVYVLEGLKAPPSAETARNTD